MDMILSILQFLDASPLTVFVGAPNDVDDWSFFFEDVFSAFLVYLVTDEERIRRLTTAVANRIMTEGSITIWRASQSFGAEAFKRNFWKST